MDGGGGYPTNPRRSNSAPELRNKGVAAEEDDPNNHHSNREKVAAVAAAATTGGSATNSTVRDQDRLMPMANVVRIMHKSLPTNAKIAEGAREAVQGWVSEFIAYVTTVANECCHQEKRRTVTAEDMLWALSKLGFDEYVEYLGQYLHRYRLLEGDTRHARRDLLPQAAGAGAGARIATASTAQLYPAPGPDHMGAPSYVSCEVFFPDEGGSSSSTTAAAAATAAADGTGVMMPQGYHGDGEAPRPREFDQGPPPFGFDLFARYN